MFAAIIPTAKEIATEIAKVMGDKLDGFNFAVRDAYKAGATSGAGIGACCGLIFGALFCALLWRMKK